jgi:hypothetical protein
MTAKRTNGLVYTIGGDTLHRTDDAGSDKPLPLLAWT